MGSYYSQVAEAIKKNQKELARLQDELRALRTVEEDTPHENYQRQHAQILYHIDLAQRQLEQNRNLLRDYENAQQALTELREARKNEEVKALRELLIAESDPQIRRAIADEIDEKMEAHDALISSLENRVQTSMGRLTDELAEEVRNSFLTEETPRQETDEVEAPEIQPDEETLGEGKLDEREQQFANELDEAESLYSEAEEEFKASLERLQAIYEEERARLESEGPFATEEELDDFTSEFMRKKIEESEKYEAARAKMSRAQKRITSIERRMREYAELKEEARRENVDVATYERIKKSATSKEVLKAVYERKGLGEVSRRSKKGKETASEVAQEVARRVIQQLRADGIIPSHVVEQEGIVNQNGGINIIGTINIVYGTDIPVKAGGSRKTTITTEEKQRVHKQKRKIKVRVVPHNGDEQQGKTPGKAPADMKGTKISPTPTGNETPTGGDSEQPTPTGAETPIGGDGEQPTPTGNETPTGGDSEQPTPTGNETPTGGDGEQPTPTGNETPTGGDGEQPTPTGDEIPIEEKGVKQFNPDGSYRLRREQIIQDDIARNTTPSQRIEPKTPVTGGVVPHTEIQPLYGPPPVQPGEQYEPQQTGLVPVEPKKPTAMVPVEPKKPTAMVPVEPKKPTPKEPQGEIQPLYGPPPTQKPIEQRYDPQTEKSPRTLMTIMDELTDGLELKAKDGKRYRASNIRCFKGFKEELCSGNYLYNIVHLVPAIVKLPFNLLRKLTGKIMLRQKSKKNIKELRERIAKLPEEDLEIIYREYRGNRVLQERFPSIINTLLEERIQQYAMSKVAEINAELEARYQSAFVTIRELEGLQRLIDDPNTSAEDRKKYETAKKELLKGQAENIAAIRRGYITANNWLTGGGLHGFSEDMKAATTKLSIVGKRFAVEHDLDRELLHRQAQLERAEAQAIAEGNDEMALRTFVESELLLSRNTEIRGSIFGRRSTGKKYYSPLAEQLDYRDDPFVRDLFTTIAVVSATITTVQSIQAAKNQADIIAENQRRMNQNNQTMGQVNQMGADIAGKRGEMMDGMRAQGMQDTLSGANEIERAVLDKTDWGLGTQAYRSADGTAHAYYTSFYGGTKSAYEGIARQYAAGQISEAQAMQMMADLTTKTHQTFGSINDACLDILRPYAQAHPQFDLTGVQGAMEYLQANPSAYAAMNQAMVDVTNAGDVLASMHLQQLIPLTTLPSSILTTIINGAATAALASNIHNSMAARKHTYGNSVTDMVDEYAEEQEAKKSNGGDGKTPTSTK